MKYAVIILKVSIKAVFAEVYIQKYRMEHFLFI